MTFNRPGINFGFDMPTPETMARFTRLKDERDCQSRQGNLRCTLDAIHRELGTACLDRSDDGVLTYWRKT